MFSELTVIARAFGGTSSLLRAGSAACNGTRAVRRPLSSMPSSWPPLQQGAGPIESNTTNAIGRATPNGCASAAFQQQQQQWRRRGLRTSATSNGEIDWILPEGFVHPLSAVVFEQLAATLQETEAVQLIDVVLDSSGAWKAQITVARHSGTVGTRYITDEKSHVLEVDVGSTYKKESECRTWQRAVSI